MQQQQQLKPLTNPTRLFLLIKHTHKWRGPQASECGRQRTLNIVHAQTPAQKKSNVSYKARMSGKCGEWRD